MSAPLPGPISSDGLVPLKLERVGDPAEDAAVVEKVLAEALPSRWERSTAVPWRAPVAAHGVSS